MYYYERKVKNDTFLIELLRSLSEKHPNYGFRKMFYIIRNQGYLFNHKKVHRVYTELGLNIKRKAKRRLPARIKHPLEVPEGINQVWSMDFMSHSLYSGRRFRVLNVIDDYNREAIWMDVKMSMGASYVVDVLEFMVVSRGKPLQIRVDNGPEFISNTFVSFCNKHHIEIKYIQPGKPTQNAFIERFNGTFRREVLNAYIFYSMKEIEDKTDEWMVEYNNERPHESLRNIPPVQYRKENKQRLKSQSLPHSNIIEENKLVF